MSVFTHSPIKLDLAAVRKGIGWAQSWTTKPILFVLNEGWMRLITVEQERFLACWSYPMPDHEEKIFFLIPPFASKVLSGPPAWEANELAIVVHKNVVGMILQDTHHQEFRLQWRWNIAGFEAPPHFTTMIHVPETIVKTSYITFADVIHFAIHSLVNPITAEDDLLHTDTAILIDFVPAQINIDGESVTRDSGKARYYFNPKLVMRGLEIVRERSIEVAIENLGSKESVLYLNSHRENWQVHCAVLSVPVTNPPKQPHMVVQEKHPPLMNGSWFVPSRSNPSLGG
jgi:hypothetical protein